MTLLRGHFAMPLRCLPADAVEVDREFVDDRDWG